MFLELEGLLPADEAIRLVAELSDAPFTDGRATAHGSARAVKRNEQLDLDHPISKRLGKTVLEALSRSEVFKAAALPHTILPIRFSRYREGMGYGDHLDLPVIVTPSGPLRTDLSLTVWLSPPDAYDGGELVIQSETGERAIKGGPGDAVLYSSSTVHRVAPVTRGERVVAISWLQSLVMDDERRAILFRISEIATEVGSRDDGAAEVMALHQLHHRLLRLWAAC